MKTADRVWLIGGGILLACMAVAGPEQSSAGVGVATEGKNAGKLVHYNQSGEAVPLRAFGVNYYDAFLRYLRDSDDTSFVQGFACLQEHNIPAARVLAAGFGPKDWALYFSDKAEFYRRLDYFIEQAERHNIGLILNCFWSVTTVGEIVEKAVAADCLIPGRDFIPANPLNTDIKGRPTYAEYKRALGRPDSGSNAWITYFTKEIVTRYLHSPAVWGWEFGNEYNNGTDHPALKGIRTCRTVGSGDMLPNTPANLKELPAWTGPDDLTRSDVQVAKENFANTVRRIDPWRVILSGDARPRSSAWHNRTEHTFTKDSRAQLAEVLSTDNPDPINTVTVHFYPGKPDSAGESIYFSDSPVNIQWESGQYRKLMDYFAECGVRSRKPLIIGEWGAIGDGTADDEKTTFNRLMQALIDSGVQLSLLWTFDSRNAGGMKSWWIQPGRVPGYPASPKFYQISNSDTNLWSLEKANRQYGSW